MGFLSSFFTINAIKIYQKLVQPSYAPPSWIFGPVWTILYILIEVAVYHVWMYGKENQEVKNAIIFYLVQLFFNFMWSLLFFALNLRGIAFIEILVLLFFIVITIIKFKKIDLISVYLLIPYLLWVSFAAILNYSVWFLNR